MWSYQIHLRRVQNLIYIVKRAGLEGNWDQSKVYQTAVVNNTQHAVAVSFESRMGGLFLHFRARSCSKKFLGGSILLSWPAGPPFPSVLTSPVHMESASFATAYVARDSVPDRR